MMNMLMMLPDDAPMDFSIPISRVFSMTTNGDNVRLGNGMGGYGTSFQPAIGDEGESAFGVGVGMIHSF